ncbi:pyrroline-5-carboxylate reductase [Bacillus sp. 03113]|uniref:pyrroline-5-carboxylate reductase n=1 Tax=Bacillus sp. 03113 TaxID=2578211 RepID=UPI0011435634|nr:pyrroline-5-carboxylate reductase [Bacillus sp. 03113]
MISITSEKATEEINMNKMTFIGAGSMAEALISGIIEKNMLPANQIWTTNRSNREKLIDLQNKYGTSFSYDLDELFKNTDIVILAMKPKDAAEAITRLKHYLTKETLLISVLAGVSISSIEMLAGQPLAVVRAMPNTSATVGKSATGLALNQNVSDQQIKLVTEMFETVGLTTIVKEEQLDAVTGLSGSGPAYIYYLIEAMEKSAVEIGLDRQLAKDLIVQTLIGAAEMVSTSSKAPEQLRKEVTSPGGTTEAGINVLEANHVKQAFIECIKTATNKSKDLGKALSKEFELSL